jgi:hypothetical protein
VLVQVIAFAFVNSANSVNARQKIDGELDVGERIFARLLEQNRDRLSQTARVMAADYGLREAIARNSKWAPTADRPFIETGRWLAAARR